MSECKFMCLIAASFVLAFAILACGRGGIPEKQLFYDVVAAEEEPILITQQLWGR